MITSHLAGAEPPLDADRLLAREHCLAEGENWLTANLPLIRSTLGDLSFTVIRWDEWLAHPEFPGRYDELLSIYRKQGSFRDTVQSDVARYARSQTQDLLKAEQLEELAKYVLEELAVYAIQASTGQITNVYPGGRLKIFQDLPRLPEVPVLLASRHYVYLDLKDQEVIHEELKKSEVMDA